MKYLYYSLYLFYVKVIKVYEIHPPIISVTAVISILYVLFICSIINAYYYDIGYGYPPYHFMIPGIGYLILWKSLYEYYKSREAKLLNEIREKPLWFRVLISILSLLFIIAVIKLWMFDGSFELYQLFKQKF